MSIGHSSYGCKGWSNTATCLRGPSLWLSRESPRQLGHGLPGPPPSPLAVPSLKSQSEVWARARAALPWGLRAALLPLGLQPGAGAEGAGSLTSG